MSTGGFEHLELAAGKQMQVPKGCVGVLSQPGKQALVLPS